MMNVVVDGNISLYVQANGGQMLSPIVTRRQIIHQTNRPIEYTPDDDIVRITKSIVSS